MELADFKWEFYGLTGNGGGKQVESLTKSLTSRHSGGSGTPGVNLNPASVEILKNLVSVMVQIVSLLDPAVDEQCGTGTEDGNSTARDELVKLFSLYKTIFRSVGWVKSLFVFISTTASSPSRLSRL